jgi:hypothetical protein
MERALDAKALFSIVPLLMIDTSCEMFAVLERCTRLNVVHEWLARRRDGELPNTDFKLTGTGHMPSTCSVT